MGLILKNLKEKKRNELVEVICDGCGKAFATRYDWESGSKPGQQPDQFYCTKECYFREIGHYLGLISYIIKGADGLPPALIYFFSWVLDTTSFIIYNRNEVELLNIIK